MTDESAGNPAERSPDPYPNRDRDGRRPVSRRDFVAGSMAVGAAATAGCRDDGGGGTPGDGNGETDATGTATLTARDTVLVFNTGDATVSVVDVADDEVVGTTRIGLSSSFPSNQYTPGLVGAADDVFWVNVGRGVRALGAGDLGERARVETRSGANWQELTPDGETLVVSAREPAHTQYAVDADPDSDGFGEVVGELDRTDEGGRGDREGPGPCDVTVHPDGDYAYVPDWFGDTLTVLDLGGFGIETQVDVAPLADGGAPKPWMGTVGPNGERLLVEHNSGIESLWDVSDPAAPAEVARFTPDDGLGSGPLTGEISADGSTGYVFTPGSDDLTVLDLDAREVSGRIDLGGSAFTGTWDPAREKLYVPVQSADVVRVVDDAAGEVVATLDVGARPYGATAATVRPDPEPVGTPVSAVAAKLGVDDAGTTYCIGNCACGHEL